MEKAGQSKSMGGQKKPEVDVSSVLKKLPSDDDLTWDSYFAPEHVKDELRHLAEGMDPDFQQRLKALRQHCCKRPGQIFRGRPMILLHGPPGTGKTHAMRMLAALLKLQPWILDVKTMSDSWEARNLFGEVLRTIASLDKAIVFLDECEGIFRSRGPMMNYALVAVTTKVELIDDFLTWVDGLQGQRAEEIKGAYLCLSTNILDHIDPAIVSRSNCMKIDLPGLSERRAWWGAHAKHLIPCELDDLGALTEGLSFRDLGQVAEKVEKAAARHGDVDVQLKHCGISQYRQAALRLAAEKSPSSAAAEKPLATVSEQPLHLQAKLEAEQAERWKLEARVQQLESESLDAEWYHIDRVQIQDELIVARSLRDYALPVVRKFGGVRDALLRLTQR
ncbi:ftsH2 [Symbiodinium necroappetens]|uniref:FtsH2 protein n=1 Tax=Symbiodinium necroappetens TaxID=1628268 RepID=A0A812NCH0_9DINO|nr:ftsH2 [Symbiodinium necroappetens]